MELKHFKLVSIIAEEGSLTKAADRLFLTQSALSHQLKEIELQLDTKIFDRVNRKLVLTQAGHIFLKSSKNIINEIEKARKEIKQHLSGEVGEIKISTQCFTCYYWLPFIIKDFQREYPNVEVTIVTDKPNTPLELLLSGKLDVAVVYTKIQDKNIEYTELIADELVAVVPVGDPLAEKEFLKPEDFRDRHFFTSVQRFEDTRFYSNFLSPASVRPKKVTFIQLTEVIIEMVKAGLGITVLTKWLLKPYLSGFAIQPVKLGAKGFRRQWYIATRKGASRPEYVTSFAKKMKSGIYI